MLLSVSESCKTYPASTNHPRASGTESRLGRLLSRTRSEAIDEWWPGTDGNEITPSQWFPLPPQPSTMKSAEVIKFFIRALSTAARTRGARRGCRRRARNRSGYQILSVPLQEYATTARNSEHFFIYLLPPTNVLTNDQNRSYQRQAAFADATFCPPVYGGKASTWSAPRRKYVP